jgi:hypothetical protein
MGGPNYPIADDVEMNIVSNLTYGTEGTVRNITWADIKASDPNNTTLYYSSRFIMNGAPPMKSVSADNIIHDFATTEFYNPRHIGTAREKNMYFVDNRIDFDDNIYEGPINVGPSIDGYGIGLSPRLMKSLGMRDGEVVYFRMSE